MRNAYVWTLPPHPNLRIRLLWHYRQSHISSSKTEIHCKQGHSLLPITSFRLSVLTSTPRAGEILCVIMFVGAVARYTMLYEFLQRSSRDSPRSNTASTTIQFIFVEGGALQSQVSKGQSQQVKTKVRVNTQGGRRHGRAPPAYLPGRRLGMLLAQPNEFPQEVAESTGGGTIKKTPPPPLLDLHINRTSAVQGDGLRNLSKISKPSCFLDFELSL
ncbi:hypothetical protein KSP40_PGU002442 [Platanthera guangdongensis]|uniref:Uncharacterized protein n=1 Tax=Platanthera guangdongensis TaxID=2320717 RepID=A0ABR2LJQ3_9ASPA